MDSTGKGVFGGVFDRVAEVYDASGVEFFKPLARRLVEHLDVRAGQRVLDVGCGRGAVLFPLAEAVGPTGSVVGIDLSPAMVAATSADAAAMANASVLEMDGQRPEFPDGSFDLITGSMSIIMIPDLPVAFANYLRLLRPGGRLGMTCPTVPADLASWTLGPFDVGRLLKEIDPSAVAADESLARFLRGEVFDTSTSFSDKLSAAGFARVVEYREDIDVIAPDAAGLVAWTQSHGMRVAWEAVPEQRRNEVQAEIIAEITERNGGDGPVSAGFPVSYLVAGA